jgi:ORF6N domain
MEHFIHVIRGQRVMIAADLAALYGVKTKVLLQAVRRNLARFPGDFMFQFSDAELKNWRSQIVTSNPAAKMGLRRAPYAFTEHGVAMLSAVLQSDQAIQMSIAVIRAFVRLRELMAAHKDIAARVEKLERGQKQAASVIEILAQDIGRLGEKVERITAPSPYRKRRIGYIVDDD